MLSSTLRKASKALLVLLVTTQAYAWDSSDAYNTIAMSYAANTTITQIINLSATQKAATTINFEVDVKNGGGRPTHDLNGTPLAYSTQTDSATITIYRYNSAGQLLGTTVSQTYILKNYGTNAGWSNAPGDNAHPFTQASVSYTGSLTDVAYIKIEMKGTDGAWWAGNYGAQWRTPTVTIGGNTTNVVYNAEFGLASNGVKAQGWTTSSGSWSACGVTSGSLTCVTQEAGVTANMWGGGEDLSGGTTSGQTGGYSGTLTSDNATQAAAGTITPAPSTPTPVPTAIYNTGSSVYITNHFPTSNNSPSGEDASKAFDNNPNTKYLNFDKQNAGVTVKLNQGRVVTGFTLTTANDFAGRDPTSYKLYGSNDGVTWTLIKEDSLSLSDSRYWTSPTISVTNTTAYVYYYIFFPTTKAGTGCGLNCDSMQIAEITYYYDANDGTTSTATGSTVTNPGAAPTAVYSSGITSSQSSRKSAASSRLGHVADVNIDGNDNQVTIQQISGAHYAKVDIQGDSNQLNITQTTTVGGRHYLEAGIVGDANAAELIQSGTDKTMFVSIGGSYNDISVNQKDTGSHYLDLTLTGNSHSVSVVQEGSGNHKATLSLTNGGGAWNFQLNQSGATSRTYSLPHSLSNNSIVSGVCNTSAGCNLTVNQP